MTSAGARTRAVAAEIVDAVVSGGQSLDAIGSLDHQVVEFVQFANLGAQRLTSGDHGCSQR